MELDVDVVAQWKRIAEKAMDLKTLSRMESKEKAMRSALRCYEAIDDRTRVAFLRHVDSFSSNSFLSDDCFSRIILPRRYLSGDTSYDLPVSSRMEEG